MGQILRNAKGIKIGEIQESCGRQIIRDARGIKKGEFDGKITRDARSPFGPTSSPVPFISSCSLLSLFLVRISARFVRFFTILIKRYRPAIY